MKMNGKGVWIGVGLFAASRYSPRLPVKLIR